jgi:cell division protein FtsI (penicillin-binding protein 3)
MTRFWFLVVFLLLIVAGLVWRIVDLSVINRSFLLGQGEARSSRIINIPAYRGMIFDRNGDPLAISTPVDAVWVNPHQFDKNHRLLPVLSKLLNIAPKDLKKRLNKTEKRSFIYLKHGVDPQVSAQVRDLMIPGVYFQREYRRYYPEGEVTAHILGFTNLDDQGQEGIELGYNQWLAGIPGKRQVTKNRLGNIISNDSVIRQPSPGHDLVLSVDRRIQYLAYAELKAGVEKYQATSGSAIVLDAQTGEILAMVNQPSYNPNNRLGIHHDGRYRNRAVTDTFEPGSTIKTFSVLTALNSGRYTPNCLIETAPGWFMIQNKKVQDEHNNGLINLTTILQKSSNVGIAKVILSLPSHALWNTLHAVGFGQMTQINFPGERSGLLIDKVVWPPFALATLSFGYGLSSTALQLTQAYAILASHGIKYPVSLLKLNGRPQGTRVFAEKTVNQVIDMLESVLKNGGTAIHGHIEGYRVAGKTGTARLVEKYGYAKHRYNSLFIGIAPATHPRLVVAVILNDPRGKHYYGGETAAPIFAPIMGGALRLLHVQPDDLSNTYTISCLREKGKG